MSLTEDRVPPKNPRRTTRRTQTTLIRVTPFDLSEKPMLQIKKDPRPRKGVLDSDLVALFADEDASTKLEALRIATDYRPKTVKAWATLVYAGVGLAGTGLAAQNWPWIVRHLLW